MDNRRSERFGTEAIGKLLIEQAVPASIGIMVMSINIIVDTIFVGQFVGSLGIGAITVVMPIVFLIASIGMAVGIGGSSVFSRALGANKKEKANHVWGNMISVTLVFSVLFVGLGYGWMNPILDLFGGKGNLLEPSREYFFIMLGGVTFLAWAMMCNPIIRALGFPKMAMITLLLPAVLNVILDPIFIIWLDMGMAGAAWASALSFLASGLFTAGFLSLGQSDINIVYKNLKPDFPLIKEMFAIGSVTLARQGTIAVLTIVLNNSLFSYGGESAVSIYGIASRCMMFALFPVMGITQGFLPVAGYNFGAQLWSRVRLSIRLSVGYATGIAFVIFIAIMAFAPAITSVFTHEEEIISRAAGPMRWIFLATPLIAVNLIGSGYFQAIGKAMPALLLALAKQGILLIPLVLILPIYFGLNGIWYSFPLADTGAALLSYWYLKKQHIPVGEGAGIPPQYK